MRCKNDLVFYNSIPLSWQAKPVFLPLVPSLSLFLSLSLSLSLFLSLFQVYTVAITRILVAVTHRAAARMTKLSRRQKDRWAVLRYTWNFRKFPSNRRVGGWEK